MKAHILINVYIAIHAHIHGIVFPDKSKSIRKKRHRTLSVMRQWMWSDSFMHT